MVDKQQNSNIPKLKNPVCPTIYPSEEKKDGILLFP